MDVIKLNEKFDLFQDHWNPRLLTQLNGQAVKIAKVKGEFVWHNHAHEDELFYVIKGQLSIHFENETKILNAGEMIVVPKGVEHKPQAENEVWLLLFEPLATKHTGDSIQDITQQKLESI